MERRSLYFARLLPAFHSVRLVLQDFHLVAVGVGDERHFLAVDEFLTPVAGPQVEFQVEAFEYVAIRGDIIDADTGMHEVFRHVDDVVGGVGELQIMRTAGDL